MMEAGYTTNPCEHMECGHQQLLANTSVTSSAHGSLEMPGSSWLIHRSRHCFPVRPLRAFAMFDHRFAPFLVTSETITMSSSGVHGPLTSLGSST